MHLNVLLLFVGIFMERTLSESGLFRRVEFNGWQWLAVVLAPMVVLAVGYWLACRLTLGSLARGGAGRRLRRLDVVSALYRVIILSLFFGDLAMGALAELRGRLGDPVLVSELLVMVPSLGMMIWGWWSYYPIDRRLRDAHLIAQIDQGLPVGPVWSRGQCLAAQLRFHLLTPLVPLTLLLMSTQVIERFVPAQIGALVFDLRPWLQLGGAGCIFLVAPVIIRHMWDTDPLPHGELRDLLTSMCRRHHVGVRELLLWRTDGGMVNAAVMGLVRPLRYILLSDALLDLMPRRQVEAVMAHELAHVRRRHIFWLIAVAAALNVVLVIFWLCLIAVISSAVSLIGPAGRGDVWARFATEPQWRDNAAMLATLVCWVVGFGWVSRRFERQADTFAVQHLAAGGPAGEHAGSVLLIDHESAQTMVDALKQVARLNHLSPQRRSWRHGSIAWRQQYLRGLVGLPIDRLPIDRDVRCIKRLTAVMLMLAGVLLVVLGV